jgi:ABC-type cobalamin transport system ATPase subunit
VLPVGIGKLQRLEEDIDTGIVDERVRPADLQRCSRYGTLDSRGIDVGAKSKIYEILYELAGQGMAIVVISSELPEVMGITDRIMVMCQGRVAADIERADFDERRILAAALPDVTNASELPTQQVQSR